MPNDGVLLRRGPEEEREMALRAMTRLNGQAFSRLTLAFADFFKQSFGEDRSPRCGRRICHPIDGLAMVLHYLCHGATAMTSAFAFGLPPATRSKYLGFGLRCLSCALKALPDAAVRWPSKEYMGELAGMVTQRDQRLQGPFAALDGSLFAIPRSGNQIEQRAYYTGHKCLHCVRSVFIFGADGAILACACNFPGSYHDSLCAEMGEIYSLIEQGIPAGYCVLADTGFRQRRHLLLTTNKIKELGKPPEVVLALRAASKIVSKTRILVEWSLGGLKSKFHVLHQKLPGDPERRQLIFDCCIPLWNYIVRTVGNCEVATVFGGDGELTEVQHDRGQRYRIRSSITAE